MKKLLASTALAFLLLVTPQAHSADCKPGASVDDMLSVAEKTKGRVTIFELTPTAVPKALKLINDRMAANGFPLKKVDRFVIVVIKGAPMVSIMYYYDGCVVPTSKGAESIEITDEMLTNFLNAAGIEDAEILQVTGA